MRHDDSRPHVIVVGGGIVGAFAAYWLARLGARATIVEADPEGDKASVCNPGGLNPLHGPGIPGGPLQALALESFALHLQVWDSVQDLSGIHFGARRGIRIEVALDDNDCARLRHVLEPYQSTPGFTAEWLERNDVLALEPRLSPEVIAGVRTQGDARVDARRYTRAVGQSASALGAEHRIARVRAIERSNGAAVAVQLDDGPVACDAVIVAVGPWTAEPARWLGVELPVAPVKGELLLVEPRGGEAKVGASWRDAAVYRRDDGRAWLGGTEERVGFDSTPSAAARAAILRRVAKLWPGLEDVTILDHVAALRPVTADGMPISGRCPGWDNVCLALGGGRKGMLLSAAMGRAAAELTVAGETGLSIAPCSVERFLDGQPVEVAR